MEEKIYKIIVSEKPGFFDAIGAGAKKDFVDLGVTGIKGINFEQAYYIKGTLSVDVVEKICRDILTDPITQSFAIQTCHSERSEESKKEILRPFGAQDDRFIEIAYNAGVMDPWEESLKKAILDLGIKAPVSVKTSKIYKIIGSIDEVKLLSFCEKILMNKVIQHIVAKNENPFPDQPEYKFKLKKINVLDADDKELLQISKDGQLFLNINEMRAIKDYFKSQGKDPIDIELETLAQTWSEHCVHKTFRGKIEYKEVKSKKSKVKSKKIDNLLKATIMKVTKKLNKSWCVSVFKDNSGIIKFDEDNNVCFKVETHNHPSALEPYGGAGTGIGGVIRDPLGTGLGAKPILNTDVFCFGPPDYPVKDIPKGTLHPKRVAKGVVSGVRDYGNRMGIPTANGAVLFDEGYIGNPLVYCGNVGIMPKDKSFKKVSPGELIVVVGGRTGRDGIHGATFSSGELTHESETISSGAVQIGNPITEKKLVDCILKARDKKLYNAITDCGAGGLSSAVGELGQETGALVNLENIPLKYAGLSYVEVWISEAQERMVLSVPKKNLKELLDLFSSENVEATHIGEFTKDKRLKLYYKNNPVCDLDMEFLHDGVPRFTRKAVWVPKKYKDMDFKCPKDLVESLKSILSHPNVASKEWVIRQYDHEVQGSSVLKPLVGINNDGPSDGCIVKPVLGSKKALIITNGINPRYGLIDPYWMAASCIDEALRQVVSCGGNLKQVAILDNFCWGNTDKPDRLGGLVRCSYGCYDAALGYGTPFISGKDSLNNKYSVHGKSVAIPGTLLISAMAVMDDSAKAISMYAKNPTDLIYIVGNTYDELGGSVYLANKGLIGNNVPKVNVRQGKKIMDTLAGANELGLVRAAHDCSEGGLGVSLAEMAFSGGLGMEIDLSKVKSKKEKVKRDDIILFSESNTRFVVEVFQEDQKKFEKAMKGISFSLIGKVTKDKNFIARGLDGHCVIDVGINELKEAWQAPLRW